MKKTKLLSLFCLLTVSYLIVSCSSQKSAVTSKISTTSDIECTQITNDGNFIINIQGNGKDADKATEDALKYAIRCLLFDGIPGSSANRIQPQKPLVKEANIRMAKQNYFQDFFENGDYRLYVDTLPNSFPRIVKVNGGVKVNVSVILKKNLLRHRLEKDGIIKSLGEQFK